MLRSICRLEKIVFGDPSDIINNLLDDKSETKINVESTDVCEKIVCENKDDEKDSEDSENSEDNKNELDQDISILNQSNDIKPEEKKAAWIDEDDYNYT